MRRFLFLSCLLATISTSPGLLSPYSVEDVREVPNNVNIDFPKGNVPDDMGVCTDVVIPILGCTGPELQEEVIHHRFEPAH